MAKSATCSSDRLKRARSKSSMNPKATLLRRDLLTAAGAAFTTSLFTGRVKGANDRIAVGFIGLGSMGSGNLGYAMQVPQTQPVSVCDVYQPHLEPAEAAAKKGGFVYVEEGQKMVEAARKYNRVVQAGTMQRSGGYCRKAAGIVQSGALGEITFCHAYQAGLTKKEGFGNPPDGEPPLGLDWDMWLGPAPKVPFNPNRWGVKAATFPTFRYFWDYAGGAMTDWGVHLIDPLHQCLGEPMPVAVSALGGKFYVEDNTETPDSMEATFQYAKFLSAY